MLKPTHHIALAGAFSAGRTPAFRFCVLAFVFLWFCLGAVPAFAKLKPLAPSEMKEATAQQGFTQFVMDNNTARMFLDIHIETYTTVNAFSAGYYEKNGTTGWDQQWSQVSIGNSTSDDMDIDGLVFMADFDGTTNDLQRVVIGSNRLQGDLTATFNSYSGTYNNALVGGNWEAVDTSRELVTEPSVPGDPTPSTTFAFNSDGYADKDMGLYFIINMEGPQQGIQVVAGFDEQSLTPGQWWDKP
ncbi:hypothetical protein [Desulfoluna spongiiphila]|uniref:hypothetical protein n=1 Tax=Desulfoluna spongiiphila TaxID=419481 RepID=UPI0012524D08|nr:hypothetical protein [Desulfoluna spongiiphila]VVS91740.1 hypothetical protein DBB_13080 [Desulfoluna spongiiphila]